MPVRYTLFVCVLFAAAGSAATSARAQAPIQAAHTEGAAPPASEPFEAPAWGIVVASTTDRLAALAAAHEQRAEGRRCIVTARVEAGRIRYRVVVGRYASPKAAAEDLRRLASALPIDAWVFRQDTAWRVPLPDGAPAREEQL